MNRQRRPHQGDGTAWLVADRLHGDFLCYWYVGRYGDYLADQARLPTAAEALAWGRARTSRVRLRTDEGFTYWAGSAPTPEGFTHRWGDKAAPEPPPEVQPAT